MTIPSFRRSSAPKREETPRNRKRERFRGSRQSRGYGRDWELLRDKYFEAKKGICEECARRGYLEMGNVVDHIEPVKDAPDKRLEWGNLQVLCTTHHAGFKARIEDFARRTGQIELLQQWMHMPESRPAAFQIMRFGPLKGLLDNGEEPKEKT